MPSRLMTLADVFGADLSAFWDPFDSATITQSGGAVSKWTDESVAGGARTGTPVNATQATAASQPTYSATGFNGKPGFNNTLSTYMDIAPVTGLPTGTADVTMFALIQGQAGYGTNSVVLSWGQGGNGTEHLFGFGNNGPYWWYTNRAGGFTNVHGTSDLTAAPSLCIVSLASSGGTLSAEMRVNSTVEATATGSPASIGSDGGRLFYTINDYCKPAKCAAGAIGVVRRAITLVEKQKLEGILLWRQGAQTSSGGPLPANHPYYAAAPTVDTGITASLAASEAPDASAASVVITTPATLAAGEPPDTAAASTTATTATALAVSEPADAASATAIVGTPASLAASELTDTATFMGSVATPASLAANEAPDTAAFSSSGAVTASLAVSEAPDAATASVRTSTAASLSVAEPNDTTVIAANAQTGTALTAIEPADTASLAASSATATALVASEAADRTAISAGTNTGAQVSVAEPPDAGSASVAAVTLVRLAGSEPIDLAAASVTITEGIPVKASLVLIEAPDTAALSTHLYPLPDFVLSGRFPDAIALTGAFPPDIALTGRVPH